MGFAVCMGFGGVFVCWLVVVSRIFVLLLPLFLQSFIILLII